MLRTPRGANGFRWRDRRSALLEKSGNRRLPARVSQESLNGEERNETCCGVDGDIRPCDSVTDGRANDRTGSDATRRFPNNRSAPGAGTLPKSAAVTGLFRDRDRAGLPARELHDQMRGQLERALLQRSEEHTSELQSLRHLVCRLL